ncbi:MAG: hypothetical protein IKL39_00045, partial [Mailhella sp.]|nr:hypothetical protein [Mailhella sp.]
MANCEFPFFLRPSLGAFSQPKRTEIASFTRGTLIRFCGHSVGNSVPIKNTPISTPIGERYLSEEPEVECFTQLAKNNRFSEKYVNSEYLQVKVESFIRWAGGKKW